MPAVARYLELVRLGGRAALPLAAGAFLMLAAAGTARAEEAAADNADDPLAVAIHELLEPKPARLDARPLAARDLLRFYRERGFRPAWDADAKTRAQLLSALASATEDGLDAGSYHLAAIEARSDAHETAQLAELDLLLTDAFLGYAHDLRLGRVPAAQVVPDIALPPQSFDGVAALKSALAAGDLAPLLKDLPPPDPGYARLKEALVHYRYIAVKGGWPTAQLPRDMRLDGSDPGVAVMRARFAAEDPIFAGTPPDKVTPLDLMAAFRRFQMRNGIDPDGKVGRGTQAAMAATVEDRIATIAANLERWRWLPRTIESRFIVVNVPDATLEAFDHGKLVLHSNVVVGDPDHITPILRASAHAVTFNPPWNVPSSIVRNEILPKLSQEPDYLERNNMVMLDGDPFRTRQLPGPKNALGGIKIEMPNVFDVYLHDSPARALFDRSRRTFSHGCIRVARAKQLALFVLDGKGSWDLGAIDAAIEKGDTHTVTLAVPVTVYVLYRTAFVDSDGTVEFRTDVYERDRALIDALQDKANAANGATAKRDTGPPA